MIMRTNCISVRLTEKESQRIRERAASSGLNVSEYIRRRSLEKQIVPEPDLRKIAELRRLGRELKQCFLESQGAHSQEMINAIGEVEKYALEQVKNLTLRQNGTREND